MGSNSGSGCCSSGIWDGAEFLCRVVVACRVSGKSGIGHLVCCTFVFCCPVVFASVVSCSIGVGLGACRVVMSVLPGFLALGWSVSGVIFLHSSRSFIWAWLCFWPEVPFKEGEVVVNCFQMFRLVVL